MPSDPARRGHAPEQLRRAFCDWVEAGMRDDEVGAELLDDGPKPLKWVLGQLHNCSDSLPGPVANGLEESGLIRLGMRRSYAEAAFQLRDWRPWNDPRGSGAVP